MVALENGHLPTTQLPAQRISQPAPAQSTTCFRPTARSTRTRTHSSAGSRTRPVSAGTRNPRALTRPTQVSN